MKSLVSSLIKNPLAEPFLYPVDSRFLILKYILFVFCYFLFVFRVFPEYYEFIEYPMDLTTLKSKISTYITIEEVITDLRIIWDNCRNFNSEGSDITKVADDFATQVESSIEVTIYLFET